MNEIFVAWPEVARIQTAKGLGKQRLPPGRGAFSATWLYQLCDGKVSETLARWLRDERPHTRVRTQTAGIV